MEGPTPVSALIHAATMVVAGVYLVARLFPLFTLTTAALMVVTFVGLLSALLAAIIACTQTDIKRVLAYSTMSQIGYMMFALGVAKFSGEESVGYTASMFHLFTHAFFKSLLFLGAGAVIHLVHSNEMKDMGGLRKYMPVTHLSFLFACLAIAGIPPFAGFFSKEEILLAAYHSNKLVYAVALFTSGLTAFYMFRLYFSIFWRKNTNLHDHHGEGTISMKIPLVMLGICTVVVGFIPFGNFVSTNGSKLTTHFDPVFSIAPVAFGVAGILLAMWMYKNEAGRAEKLAAALGGLYRTVYHKFYIDEIYLFITKKIIFNLIGRPAAWIDRNIVDGAINGIAWTTGRVSAMIKGLQSGKVQSYALYFFGGIVVLGIIFLYLWT
jgi:NADH-quinone oxidoreductase subunit L